MIVAKYQNSTVQDGLDSEQQWHKINFKRKCIA